ncbi:tripartite-type tricarboxylate transporter receptor subunit TctC [Variovorax beijingensis]|uniref:Tripartite-type tricarboxylate transporter receptor subunit TctC n=2 Tax=Variovorax TaxID=34072 RepID=A0AAE3Y5V9_VARPD|nr:MULTISPECIES: tripartite tricarboxylate transporter substrate binding protein [Variovorax]MDP9968681.1 tripartite-type tricarboxylate transporter receptor subunit TctC [Variovorax paradoxus]MDR6430199.1 tripartite-type tricarboxylate transporter receptor subunit TctC [Variovorax paradoxus]MDR6456840.1 tripartite-type tricarboxylate transporter receptor subunit TctC [Variovorax paradoxus]TWD73505.1 tripartite-type tricarboxylate transporter receptor subunit TctC [Variovorax beijingensis]
MPTFKPTSPLRRRAVAAFALAACLPAAAMAADWRPDHPVTLVVPYSPGGGTDAQTRVVAKELQQIWGQPVIVENVPGADGLIGTRKVIEAKPNGLTLLVQLPSLTLIRHLPTFKGVDPLAQLAPVSAFSALPGVVTVNAALPVKSMEQLVRYCRRAATTCSVGTTENMARLQARMLGEENALPSLVVANYKGGGQMITDLVANNISFAIAGSTAVMPFVKTGALRVVMTMGDRRSAALPDVPTAIEAGFASFDATTWYGLFAPKGTPAGIQQGIAAAVREAVKSEEVRKSLSTIGAEPVGNTPAEFTAMVQREARRVEAQVKRFPLE